MNVSLTHSLTHSRVCSALPPSLSLSRVSRRGLPALHLAVLASLPAVTPADSFPFFFALRCVVVVVEGFLRARALPGTPPPSRVPAPLLGQRDGAAMEGVSARGGATMRGEGDFD